MEKPLREKLFGKPVSLGEKIEALKAEAGLPTSPAIKVEREPGSDKQKVTKSII